MSDTVIGRDLVVIAKVRELLEPLTALERIEVLAYLVRTPVLTEEDGGS